MSQTGVYFPVFPDYPRFGSSEPLTERPTFDRLAEVTAEVVDAW